MSSKSHAMPRARAVVVPCSRGARLIAQVNMLLTHECSADGVDDYRRTPLHIAAWSGLMEPLAKLLTLARGALPRTARGLVNYGSPT